LQPVLCNENAQHHHNTDQSNYPASATDVTVAEWVILRERFGKNDQTSPGTIAD
jgi:hypothetical protein